MKVIDVKSDSKRIQIIKKLIESAGNQIGNIHFYKRSDGSLRKLSYRLGVKNPTYVKASSGKKVHQMRKMRKDSSYNLITVFDTNVLSYDKSGKLNGRGGWRSIPLDGVTRVSVGGTIYRIK